MKKLTMENAFEVDECAILEIQKMPGVEQPKSRIEATSAVAALKALALLTKELARVMCVPEEYVICNVTTILLAPEIPTQETAIPENH